MTLVPSKIRLLGAYVPTGLAGGTAPDFLVGNDHGWKQAKGLDADQVPETYIDGAFRSFRI